MSLEDFMGGTEVRPVIVDMSQISLAAALQVFEHSEPIKLGMLRHVVLNTLKANVTRFKNQGYNEIVLGIDNAANGYWRRDLAYYYKKHRAEEREKSLWDWEGYFENIRVIIDEFKKYMPYKVIDIDKVEADDIIAVVVKLSHLNGSDSLIVSSDSDFTQLHKYNVKQWSPMQKKFVKPKHGSSYADLMYKLLKGDRKDTIAGINSVSDYWLVREEGQRAKSVPTKLILDCMDKNPEEVLNEDQYKRFVENRLLLDFDYIPESIVNQIKNEYAKPTNNGSIYSYFVKSGLSKLLTEIEKF